MPDHSDREGARSAPLAGLRVLDFTRVLSGPYATMLLADLGADIVKIEDPDGGDSTRLIPPLAQGESHYFLALNRSKSSVAVDLKHPDAPLLIRRLAARCDVVVENFRPGVMDRLGIGYENLSLASPALIYCSLSAFGQDGPYSKQPGFDLVIQGLSGAMHLTGAPGGPMVRFGLSMGDLAAGLFAVIGIEAALVERARTERGRFVDISMLDGLVGLLTYHATRFWMTNEESGPVGSGHPGVVPYGAYRALDGYVTLAPLSESFWSRMCQALDLMELVDDPRYRSNRLRLDRREELDAIVASQIQNRTVAEWCRRLEAADVPHGPVLSVGGALAHPQVQARGLVTEIEHPVVGPVPALSSGMRFDVGGGAPGTPPKPAPLLGQHTRITLKQLLDLTDGEIDDAVMTGVIFEATADGDAERT